MKAKRQPDLPVVTERAVQLAQQAQVQYWIVVSCQDGIDLCEGRVPDSVKVQCFNHLRPDKLESREQYALRISEATR